MMRPKGKIPRNGLIPPHRDEAAVPAAPYGAAGIWWVGFPGLHFVCPGLFSFGPFGAFLGLGSAIERTI